MSDEKIPLGRYGHYKGRIYEVIGVGETPSPEGLEKQDLMGTARYSEDLTIVEVYAKRDEGGKFFLDGKIPNDIGYIIYKALYDSEEFGHNALWVRPKEMFLEEVTVDGKKIPRFKRLNS